MNLEIDTTGTINIGGVPDTQIVTVNGVPRVPQPRKTKFFRAVRDKDEEYWVEIREGVWRCMRPSPMDSNERKLDQVALKYGPLTTE
jgi:hypothetical protein